MLRVSRFNQTKPLAGPSINCYHFFGAKHVWQYSGCSISFDILDRNQLYNNTFLEKKRTLAVSLEC
uniref:Uncharacterized protein n=1 Tax=Parascaris univalens TaxID=6257 RepID=A0A915BT29_PARUN